MKIQPIKQDSNNNSFRAKLVSRATVNMGDKVQKIDLYSLSTKEDLNFMRKIYCKLNLKKLYPEDKSYKDFDIWKEFIVFATERIGNDNVILAVKDKKPCGIMSYINDGLGSLFLTYLSRWRPDKEENVAHIGKILMHNLISHAKYTQANSVELVASRITPLGKCSKDFYKSLGFADETYDSSMVLYDYAYDLRLNWLEKYFTTENINNSQEVNLSKELADSKNRNWFRKIFKNIF